MKAFNKNGTLSKHVLYNEAIIYPKQVQIANIVVMIFALGQGF